MEGLVLSLALLAGTVTANAEGKYGPGATDTEILIGQTNPYSGPLSSYGTQGRSQTAYYAMINEQGGVNGR
jgi:ABC-type branched-subunit amino acid transport system substrate-binding protein